MDQNREPSPTPTPTSSVQGDNRNTSGSGNQTQAAGSQTGVLQAVKLPQTGMLLWPVVALAVTGLLVFCLGWADINVRRKKDE